MKLALLLIPLLFFMTSCTIDWNDEKDKKIAELKKQIQDDTFKKKQECASHYDEIIKGGNGGYINTLSLKEIFYSNTNNSCLYIVEDDNKYSIVDYFGKREIFKIDGPIKKCGGIDKLFTEEFKSCNEGIRNEFDAKIQELKGE